MIKDLEENASRGVISMIVVRLVGKFKYFIIYKKSFYQWGMSPLAFLAYLIYYFEKIVNFL